MRKIIARKYRGQSKAVKVQKLLVSMDEHHSSPNDSRQDSPFVLGRRERSNRNESESDIDPFDIRAEYAAANEDLKEHQAESPTKAPGQKLTSASEDGGSAGVKKREKKKCWLQSEEQVLIDVAKELVKEGMRGQVGFKPGFLVACAERIARRVRGSTIRVVPHVKSKIHMWKKIYDLLSDFLGMSEVSVDPSTHRVVVEDETTWDSIVRTNSDYKLLRGKPFPLYEDWCEIFVKDRATGGYTRDGGYIGEGSGSKSTEEEEDIRASEDGGVTKVVPRVCRNKRKWLVTGEDEKSKCYSEIWLYVKKLHTPVDPPLDIARRLMDELRPYTQFNVWTRTAIVSHLLDNVSARQIWQILEEDVCEEGICYLVDRINDEVNAKYPKLAQK